MISLRYIERAEKKHDEGIDLYNKTKGKKWEEAQTKAIAYLGKAIEFDRENIGLLNRRGIFFFEVNDIPNAIAHHREAIRLAPQNHIGYMNLANLLAETNPVDAKYYINKASELSPLNPEVEEIKFKILHELKTNPKFSDNVEIPPEKLASLKEEEAKLSSKIKEDSKNYQLYVLRANVLKQQRRYADALKDYTAAVELRPDIADGYIDIGLMYKKLKKRDMAIQAYDKAIGINPLNATAHYNKGVVLVEMDQPYSALESLDLAVKINPEDQTFQVLRNTINDMLCKKES